MSESLYQLRFLSDQALDRIEETAYRLLEEVGISLQHATATEMLRGRGCRVDKGRVFIPRDVVSWMLDNITPHTQFFNRDGSAAFVVGDGQLRFHNAGGLPFTLDLETGARRLPTLQDVADMSRLLDALPHVDMVIPHFGPQDVHPDLLAVASTGALLRNTRKPVSAAAIDRPQDVPYVVEMAAACCGGMEAYRARPTMYISVSPVSPLTFTHDVTAAIIAVAESGTPFNTLPAPSLGATGPVTLAGALAQQHAEVLASFVIAAAARPGAPVTYCSRINPIDLRTAVSSWGGPEIGIRSGVRHAARPSPRAAVRLVWAVHQRDPVGPAIRQRASRQHLCASLGRRRHPVGRGQHRQRDDRRVGNRRHRRRDHQHAEAHAGGLRGQRRNTGLRRDANGHPPRRGLFGRDAHGAADAQRGPVDPVGERAHRQRDR